jgi:hypothetical protein
MICIFGLLLAVHAIATCVAFAYKDDTIVAWYDLWIGVFYDTKKRWVYFFPVPCWGMIIKLDSHG